MRSCMDCSITLGTFRLDSIIFLNRILLARSNLLASSKLLDLLIHSSCSKDKAGLEGLGIGEGEGEEEAGEGELLNPGNGELVGGEGLFLPSINKANWLGKYTKLSFIFPSTNKGKKAKS